MASMVVAFFGAGCFFVVVSSVSSPEDVVAIVRRAPLAATLVRPFRLHPRSSMKPGYEAEVVAECFHCAAKAKRNCYEETKSPTPKQRIRCPLHGWHFCLEVPR
jgi:hypothetical protein